MQRKIESFFAPGLFQSSEDKHHLAVFPEAMRHVASLFYMRTIKLATASSKLHFYKPSDNYSYANTKAMSTLKTIHLQNYIVNKKYSNIG